MKINIHRTAEVQTDQIGNGTVIWQNTIILKGAVIGNNCNINCNVFIENDVIIGDNVTIKPGVQIWDGSRIGNNVFIGPNATFTNDLTPRSKQYPEKFGLTTIEEGASIGANATIITEKIIGRYSLIGAGSVITKDIPPFTIWFGNPASHQGYITRTGTAINLALQDKKGKRYSLINGEPILND